MKRKLSLMGISILMGITGMAADQSGMFPPEPQMGVAATGPCGPSSHPDACLPIDMPQMIAAMMVLGFILFQRKMAFQQRT